MTFLNKRGDAQEAQYNWLLGAIVGIALTTIIVLVAIQWYQTTQKTQESFDELVTKIQEIEDHQMTAMPYFLPDEYALISFDGSNFGDADEVWRCPKDSILDTWIFNWQLEIPETCTGPCLCICERSFGETVLEPDACAQSGARCSPLDIGYNPEFKDPNCPYGVFKTGPSSGIITLYLNRTGTEIFFCEQKECPPPKSAEQIAEDERLAQRQAWETEFTAALEAAKQAISDYKTCQASTTDCACGLDTTFLEKTMPEEYQAQYGKIRFTLVFSVNQVSLNDLLLSKSEAVDTLTTNMQIGDPIYAQFYGPASTYYLSSADWEMPSEEEVASMSDESLKQIWQELTSQYGYITTTQILTVSSTGWEGQGPPLEMPAAATLEYKSGKMNVIPVYSESTLTPCGQEQLFA